MINLGRHSYCYGVQRGTMNNVNVGNFTSIAEGVIFDGGFNHDYYNFSTFPMQSIWHEAKSHIKPPKDINIGHDVWIGEGAMIMGGVTIGNGSVIGARAVVTKDIPDYEIWAGVPAKKIEQRFSPYAIEQLQRIQWWNWSDERIKDNLHLFGIPTHITTFIHKHV